MPSKKRKSEVVIRGPAKIHRADCSTIQVGLGGEIRMTNEQWKGWIEGGGKIISDLAGKVLAFEAAGEISNSIVSDEEFSTDVAIARADTQTDFRLMRTNGQPLAFVYKEGNNTFAEAVAPAATGKVWVGFQTEQFQKTDLADLSALDDIIVRLHVAQWTPTPHSVVAGRFSMILRNLTDGVNEQEVISAIINPLSPVPVVNCVSPRALSMAGGQTVVITGKNFLAGASVEFGRIPAAAVSIISTERIEATSPFFPAAGQYGVVVINSASNGAQASVDNWQQVSAS